MAKALFSQPRFTNDDAARKYLESVRWPKGPVCPHCGGTERNSRLRGESHRPGLIFCGDCRTQFTVTVGTVFERSKVPLHKWLLANHLLCSSKKGISSNQLHRLLGVTLKTAWFMSHRIREAWTTPSEGRGPLGGGGKIVEVDETYYGRKDGVRKHRREGKYIPGVSKRSTGPRLDEKRPIIALVERDGETRAYHVPNVTSGTLRTVLNQVSRDAHLLTDEATRYWNIGKEFAKHTSVNHSKGEYSKGNGITTNTVEGFFGILKRGLNGTYHHVSEAHLQRYVTEFSFRYNNRQARGVSDEERAANTLKQIAGKRLTYRRTYAQA
jgi:transposase-like protein